MTVMTALPLAAEWRSFRQRLLDYVRGRVEQPADAEDLTQQTFLQAWKAIGRYRRGGAPFIAWLLTISQRLATSHYRKTREVAGFVDAAALGQAADPAEMVSAGLAQDAVRAFLDRKKE